MSSVQRMHNQAIGSSSDNGADNVYLRTELECVSSRLNSFNQMNTGPNMNDWMQAIQSYAEEVATLEPKLNVVSKLVRDELRQIKGKEEGEIHEFFQQQIDEYKKAKDQLKQLQGAHDEHTENAANLSDDLKSISEELDRRKKQIDSMVNNVTDANPVVEIRAAIQRLRKENRELDIYIGMLDYELTVARYPQKTNSHKVDEIEDEHDQHT